MPSAPAIRMICWSLEDFGEVEVASRILQVISQAPEDLVPTSYGVWEPERRFMVSEIEHVLETWLNRKGNPNSGQIQFYSDAPFKVDWRILWEREAANPRFNTLTIRITPEYFGAQSRMKGFMALLNGLISSTKSVFTQVSYQKPPHRRGNLLATNSPVDLRTRLPELQWMQIFGEPYVQMFGRERLLSAPCSVEAFPSGHIGLTIGESPQQPIDRTLEAKVREHLGADAL